MCQRGQGAISVSNTEMKAKTMKTENITFPTAAEIDAITLRAHELRAQTLRAGVRKFVAWMSHPSLPLRHA